MGQVDHIQPLNMACVAERQALHVSLPSSSSSRTSMRSFCAVRMHGPYIVDDSAGSSTGWHDCGRSSSLRAIQQISSIVMPCLRGTVPLRLCSWASSLRIARALALVALCFWRLGDKRILRKALLVPSYQRSLLSLRWATHSARNKPHGVTFALTLC